jgi:hypothetical protein
MGPTAYYGKKTTTIFADTHHSCPHFVTAAISFLLVYIHPADIS